MEDDQGHEAGSLAAGSLEATRKAFVELLDELDGADKLEGMTFKALRQNLAKSLHVPDTDTEKWKEQIKQWYHLWQDIRETLGQQDLFRTEDVILRDLKTLFQERDSGMSLDNWDPHIKVWIFQFRQKVYILYL